MARTHRPTPAWTLTAALLCLVAGTARAAPLTLGEVPEPLKPWVAWVLHDAGSASCPYEPASSSDRRCVWPSRLALALTDTGGEFEQTWLVYEGGWVPLPGDAERWPQEVKVGDALAVVQMRGGQPGLELEAGSHRVTGTFLWDSLPEKLAVPAETGLLALKIRGEPVTAPQRDNSGVLWLQRRDSAAQSQENLLEVLVHRKIADTIPLRVTTQVEVQASGKNREVLLGKALLAGFVPMSLSSELPARLEPDGRLRVQIRPGRWVITIEARNSEPAPQLALGPSEGPWASEEIWAFAAEPALRRVEITGVTAVDPQQTLLPEAWKRLPAFRVRPGEAMQLAETHRGQVDRGPDQLALERTWWLDFDGRGLSVRDHLSGEAFNTRRLEARAPAQLGYAAAQGEPQFITALSEGGQPGVELRSDTLDLTTDMRVPAPGLRKELSAVDWDQDFARVHGRLHLPPGWRLLHATGVDEIDDTWLQRWTLLDIFLVLIISIAIGRLYGWAWGTLAVVTLALVFPEWMAPRTVWIFVLVGEALHRALPAGRGRTVVQLYRAATLVVLTGVVVTFTAQQVRGGLYPALAMRSEDDSFGLAALDVRRESATASQDFVVNGEYAKGEQDPLRAPMAPQAMEDAKEVFDSVTKVDSMALDSMNGLEAASKSVEVGGAQAQMRKQQKLREYDASTVVQTGAGVPGWRWRAVSLGWNGPVTRDQQVRLFLTSPQLNLALAFVRVLFLATLLLAMFGVFARRRRVVAGRVGPAVGLLLAFGTGMLSPGLARAELPSQEVLTELRARLTEPPRCLPECVTSPRMRIEASERGLRVVQELHVAAFVSVPLPGSAEQWLPSSVWVDGSPMSGGLARTAEGVLLLELRPGQHEVVLEGPLPVRETVQIALPLKPHRVEAKAKGWSVEGIHEDGLADDNLQLTRVSSQEAGTPSELEAGSLPPFVQLERSLQLGLAWEVTTRVLRRTPRGAAVVLSVPLLPGESVTTADLRVEGGAVLVNMGPEEDEVRWTSALPITPQIRLSAARGEPWTEVWRVEVGAVWHVEHEGLPTVRQGEAGLREWQPWPGEEVALTVTRPQGVPGQTLTIDAATLHLEPGLRAVDARLSLTLRSSRGGHHVVRIPEGALLQTVTIDGLRQTIGQDGQQVRVPVEPGSQTVELAWRETSGLGERYVAPQVDLGGPAVNVNVEVTLPQSRWILLVGGPRLGPAVLFWSYVIMLLLAAALLSRLRWTPLRGHQWFLLGIGLSPIELPLAMIVVGWFLAIAWRRERTVVGPLWFDLRQLLLVGWTVVACMCLVEAIHRGLLGQPDMQIEGNGSWGGRLQWYQDRVEASAEGGGLMPRPWALSVSMWWYRGMMLGWALWLAWLLVRWLPLAWHSFGVGGRWRPWTRPAAPRRMNPRPVTMESVVATGGLAPHSSSVSAVIYGAAGQSLASVEATPPPHPSDTLPSTRVGSGALPGGGRAPGRTVSGSVGEPGEAGGDHGHGEVAPTRTRATPPPVPSTRPPGRDGGPRGSGPDEG